MWNLLLIPIVMVVHDYMKAPIDKLYFSNWKRPMIGIRNTFIDILLYSKEYSTWNFKGLWLKSLTDQIPSIYNWTCAFAVMEGPMTIPPHRAETNHLLRYHITIFGDGDCTLYTENGPHVHHEGGDFIFDHSRYHEIVKTGDGRRVVLILDVHRI